MASGEPGGTILCHGDRVGCLRSGQRVQGWLRAGRDGGAGAILDPGRCWAAAEDRVKKCPKCPPGRDPPIPFWSLYVSFSIQTGETAGSNVEKPWGAEGSGSWSTTCPLTPCVRPRPRAAFIYTYYLVSVYLHVLHAATDWLNADIQFFLQPEKMFGENSNLLNTNVKYFYSLS